MSDVVSITEVPDEFTTVAIVVFKDWRHLIAVRFKGAGAAQIIKGADPANFSGELISKVEVPRMSHKKWHEKRKVESKSRRSSGGERDRS
jgi:hypothetical protein